MEAVSQAEALLSHAADNIKESDAVKKVKPRRWVKKWVIQDSVINNGKCFLLKWVSEEEAKIPITPSSKSSLDQLSSQPVLLPSSQKPSPGGVYPCQVEGCGKIFSDAGALRKHSHVHGERQYICQYEGCGKKFVDSSKLKRHHLIHTGEKHFVCPFEGCGKAFSLDFNRRSHMRTHTGENYHTCPVVECGKRFAHENKLRSHMQTAHAEKDQDGGSGEKREGQNQKEKDTVERTFVCPFEGCQKRYLHEYKLNLHLKKEHGPKEKPEIGGGETSDAPSKAGTSHKSEGDSEEDGRENMPLIFSQGGEFMAASSGGIEAKKQRKKKKKEENSENNSEGHLKKRRGRPPKEKLNSKDQNQISEPNSISVQPITFSENFAGAYNPYTRDVPLEWLDQVQGQNLQGYSQEAYEVDPTLGWSGGIMSDFGNEVFGGDEPSFYFGDKSETNDKDEFK